MRVASCGLQVAGCPAESGIAERETMKNYKDLEIYQLSYELAIKVHKMSLKLPKYEIFEEGSQLRRSSKGITSTIVEGYG